MLTVANVFYEASKKFVAVTATCAGGEIVYLKAFDVAGERLAEKGKVFKLLKLLIDIICYVIDTFFREFGG